MSDPELVTVQTCEARHDGIDSRFQSMGIEVRDIKDDVKCINSRIFTMILMVALTLLGIIGNVALTVVALKTGG